MKRSEPFRSIRWLLGSLAFVLFGVPASIVLYGMHQWSHAERVIGRVIAVEPENTPFPDRLTIRYLRPEDDQEFNVTLSAFQTSARQVGDETELFYLSHAPEKALPRSEIPFEGLPVSPHWLVASVITSAILLIFAFPEYIPLQLVRRVVKGAKWIVIAFHLSSITPKEMHSPYPKVTYLPWSSPGSICLKSASHRAKCRIVSERIG